MAEKKDHCSECSNEIFEDNKCILHCEKTDWYDNKRVNLFWTKIKDDLNKLDDRALKYDEYCDLITYERVVFPSFQEDIKYDPEYNNFKDMDSNFYSIYSDLNDNDRLNKIIDDNEIVFKDCTFLDVLDLKRYTFNKSITFINPTFKKEILFNKNSNKVYKFKDCTFAENIDFSEFTSFEKLTFDNVKFCKTVNFMNITSNYFEFKNVNVSGLLNIFNCTINKYKILNLKISEVIINSTIFTKQIKEPFINNNLNFTRSVQVYHSSNLPILAYSDALSITITNSHDISMESSKSKLVSLYIEDSSLVDIKLKEKSSVDRLKLKNVVVKNIFDIGNLCCNLKLELENISFGLISNFLNIKTNRMTRETARIIKDIFEKQNNIIEANKFYALEMRERELELKKEGSFFEKLVFKVHGLSSNHSQNWVLPIFWIFIIGMISSYFDFNLIKKGFEYVHFEIISIIKVIALIFIIYIIENICSSKKKIERMIYYFTTSVMVYMYATHDYFLSFFSKTINPFSVMKSVESLNILQLFFKIIIAYLIYQLIISIRQNTRRK